MHQDFEPQPDGRQLQRVLGARSQSEQWAAEICNLQRSAKSAHVTVAHIQYTVSTYDRGRAATGPPTYFEFPPLLS
jgi:hypothetical protein